MADLFRSSAPVFAIRGVHLDLKGVPPTFARLCSLLKVFAAAGFNALLVEWEDMFPWTVDARFRCETAYSREQVKEFATRSSDLGMEIIPLVQCLGHMETPLSVPGYEHLRELPYLSNCLNPLAPGSRELLEAMIDDVLSLTPGARYFHLGGDEAWSFGRHPDTKAFIARHGKGKLYLQHVEPLLDKLAARSIRPILWSDMMHDWPSDALRSIAAKADLCPWGYGGHPDNWKHHSRSANIARFHEHGVKLWSASAYKGAEGHNVDLPNLDRREENAIGWADVAGRFGMVGNFATAWSRNSTHRVQHEPIDACLDALMLVGVALHDGQKADRAAVEASLRELGEWDRLQACKSALEKIADARFWSWKDISRLHEQVALETMDVRRRESGMACDVLKDIKRHVGVGAAGGIAEFYAAMDGMMDRIWLDRYIGERFGPIREELAMLNERVRLLEPGIHQAMFGS